MRLRVVADPATVDQRFILDEEKADRIEAVVGKYWPEKIDVWQIGDGDLAAQVIEARNALLSVLNLDELI